MDSTSIDLIVRIVPIVASIIATGRILYDLVIGTRTRIRDEYVFAKEFFKDLNEDPNMHPYVKEKGYQAIAGDKLIKSDEIAYLLSVKEPGQALRDYSLGRYYLQHVPQSGIFQIQFKPKYQGKWARRSRLLFFICLCW